MEIPALVMDKPQTDDHVIIRRKARAQRRRRTRRWFRRRAIGGILAGLVGVAVGLALLLYQPDRAGGSLGTAGAELGTPTSVAVPVGE